MCRVSFSLDGSASLPGRRRPGSGHNVVGPRRFGFYSSGDEKFLGHPERGVTQSDSACVGSGLRRAERVPLGLVYPSGLDEPVSWGLKWRQQMEAHWGLV